MSKTKSKSQVKLGPMSTTQVANAIREHFGEPVLKLTAPGGKTRGSFRAYLSDRSIIVSCRDKPEHNDHEVIALEKLSPLTDDAPKILGRSGPLIFQSDVGSNRLNIAIHKVSGTEREELAIRAISALFNIQRAAARTDLKDHLPHVGNSREWVKRVVTVGQRLAKEMGFAQPNLNLSLLNEAITQPAKTFVKWDARAGNAALDDTGKLRWFDFEYSGYRHGAEDLAWLIADETWPLTGETMIAMTRDILTDEDTHNAQAYIDYLEQYTVLQAIIRLRLIIRNARKHGWFNRVHLLKYDKIGVDPFMAEALVERAMIFAERHKATRPLLPTFESTAQAFRESRAA